jgi:hypothetical protein
MRYWSCPTCSSKHTPGQHYQRVCLQMSWPVCQAPTLGECSTNLQVLAGFDWCFCSIALWVTSLTCARGQKHPAAFNWWHTWHTQQNGHFTLPHSTTTTRCRASNRVNTS